ncbi:hypothetical protein TRICHSKD4_0992 [Roseibium sp. TrichSKD4]|uniref:hypothetical protein n=1 Tax=Roseibium sp. TrichSKD4 TaxID=744980 RepID=UPI0001E56321|nr:hypothetical protein [Roseibium sp. TrichSKD4]EFO33873.1 hypothetical protein TRICHSKD4_0992 [Roseibium sp. TrichSKD4]
MSIFTSNSSLVAGKELASIIGSDETRENFIQNPKQVLTNSELPNNLVVLADTADTIHLVVPAQVDVDRIVANDEAYFEELGQLALSACMYEDIPE